MGNVFNKKYLYHLFKKIELYFYPPESGITLWWRWPRECGASTLSYLEPGHPVRRRLTRTDPHRAALRGQPAAPRRSLQAHLSEPLGYRSLLQQATLATWSKNKLSPHWVWPNFKIISNKSYCHCAEPGWFVRGQEKIETVSIFKSMKRFIDMAPVG